MKVLVRGVDDVETEDSIGGALITCEVGYCISTRIYVWKEVQDHRIQKAKT